MGIRVQSDEALEELRAFLDRIITDLEAIKELYDFDEDDDAFYLQTAIITLEEYRDGAYFHNWAADRIGLILRDYRDGYSIPNIAARCRMKESIIERAIEMRG